MAKVYKIAERHFFRKFTKGQKSYKDSISFGLITPIFNTREEAEKYLEDRVSNDRLDFENTGFHYEKIAKNTYKLTWKDSDNFRILSFHICEFTTEEEFI